MIRHGDSASEPLTPEPVVYRERPPRPPAKQEDKIVTIPGKIIQKPRKIIIEHIFREVRYEDVPPQMTREQIRQLVLEKLKKESKRPVNLELDSFEQPEGSSSFEHASAPVIKTQQGSAVVSNSVVANNSEPVSEQVSPNLMSEIPTSTTYASDSFTPSLSNESPSNVQTGPVMAHATHPNPHPMPFGSHVSLPIRNLPAYTPRVNRYSQSQSMRIPVGHHFIHFNDRHISSLSAEFVPNGEMITEMDMYDENNRLSSRFRRVGSLKPHRDVRNNLRLLGFAF